MATIKSYTNISQSKKLAEILPIESADMYYPWYIEEDRDNIKSGHRISIPSVGNFIHKVNILPCWSLSALIDILPNSIYDNTDEYSQLEFSKISVAYHDMNDGIKVGSIKDNLVDACYEMILKLHELKML